ncbi:hypothetical protein OSB04_028817 [Centaurea solstitialis]|uniref:Uncharacterized protein n=1 Tax=Centaurea solstitialis TaxID=347529 RepID=A0AA38SUU5_9ASTR|nr:hypothetical protein OSB04_028817 [Centaurea solstitialis]
MSNVLAPATMGIPATTIYCNRLVEAECLQILFELMGGRCGSPMWLQVLAAGQLNDLMESKAGKKSGPPSFLILLEKILGLKWIVGKHHLYGKSHHYHYYVYSVRVRKPSQDPVFYYGFHNEEDKISDNTLIDFNEPANYKEAMAILEATKWKEAMNSKI